MHKTYLIHHEDATNKHRFYQMFITPDLFGDWSLIKEWGRIGSPGTVRKEWFDTQEQAQAACEKIIKAKCKKGYQALLAA